MEETIRNIQAMQVVTPKQRRQATTKRANAKIEEISERLRDLVFEKGAGSQLPTIRELCTLLNTSSATLTAALDLLEVEQIICRKERQGIFVSTSLHQKTIHVLFNVTSITNIGESPFWSLLWGKMLREAEQNATFKNVQYRFHFFCHTYGEALPNDYIALLNSSQVDGCLLIGMNARTPEHKSLLHLPHVVFAGGGDLMVHIDIEKIVQAAVQSLVQLQCKKIACWVRVPSAGDPQDVVHYRLFREALAEQDCPFHPELLSYASVPPSSNGKSLSRQEQGYLLVKEVFGQFNDNRPDGVYITDDMMTSGALAAFEDLGIKIGTDVKIASHSVTDSPILFGKTKQMVLLEVDPADIVRAMFSLLDTAIINGYEPGELIFKVQPHIYF